MFLDCSTIDVAEAREAAAAAEAAGMRAADAPVSGGQVGAEAGTLAFMVGASDEVYAEVLPLLEVMGARIVHCGAAGLGQAAKICNNMVLGVTQIAVAEAKVLTTEVALAASNKLFELSGTRSTLAAENLDRHWRNARTHTLHDPVRWKYAIVGNHALTGVNPPLHAWS